MPTNDDIRKSVKQYEQSLPESQRNPNAKEDIERLIERAAQPLQPRQEQRRDGGDYTDTQTRSRKTGDTSD